MQIFLRQISAPQDAYDLAVIMDRRIETGHRLIEKMGIEYDIRADAAIHAVYKKAAVGHIGSSAVADMVNTIGICKEKYVEQGMFGKVVQHGKSDDGFGQSVFYKISISGNQIQSVVELLVYFDSCLARRVGGIDFVLFFHPPAVLRCVPEKQQDDCCQEKQDICNVLQCFFTSHKFSPQFDCLIAYFNTIRGTQQ